MIEIDSAPLGQLKLRAWPLILAGLAVIASAIAWTPMAAAFEYKIGPDDILAISVLDQKDLDQVVTVRPDGRISLPLVGEIGAAGLTVGELAARLTTAYGRTVRGAQVAVSVREIRSRPAYFVGGVVRPGPLHLTQEMTVLEGLAAVGGPASNADLQSAFVQRGQQRILINIQSLLRSGDSAQNLRLQPGDTVVVPRACGSSGAVCVFVLGAVKTPGSVRYVAGMTATMAAAEAGGFTDEAGGFARSAAPRRVRLTVQRDKRIFEIIPWTPPVMKAIGGETVFWDNAHQGSLDRVTNDMTLEPNDTVTVFLRERLF